MTRDCIWCGEPLLDTDALAPDHAQPIHYECGLRSAVGSVNHQKRLCRCYGGSENDDPPGLTRRQAAQAAMIYFHSTKPRRSNDGDD